MLISLIVAISKNHVIGKNNQLPWHLPADLKFFKNLTMGHPIIMGRKTYESIGKPLPGRTSIIITSAKNYKAEGCIIVNSLQEAINIAKSIEEKEIFVIGGASIFEQALPIANKIYLTIIHENFEGDTYLPQINPNIWKETKRVDFVSDEKNKYAYTFCEFDKIK